MLTNITPGRYLTREGREAVVLAVLDVTCDPVIGYTIVQEKYFSYASALKWELNGRVYMKFGDEYDLIERIEE